MHRASAKCKPPRRRPARAHLSGAVAPRPAASLLGCGPDAWTRGTGADAARAQPCGGGRRALSAPTAPGPPAVCTPEPARDARGPGPASCPQGSPGSGAAAGKRGARSPGPAALRAPRCAQAGSAARGGAGAPGRRAGQGRAGRPRQAPSRARGRPAPVLPPLPREAARPRRPPDPDPGRGATVDPATCPEVCVPPARRGSSGHLRSAESVSGQPVRGAPATQHPPAGPPRRRRRRARSHRPRLRTPSARAPGAAARPAGSCSPRPAGAGSGGGLKPQFPGGPAAALTPAAAGGAAAQGAGGVTEGAPAPRRWGGQFRGKSGGSSLALRRRGRRARVRGTAWEARRQRAADTGSLTDRHHAGGRGRAPGRMRAGTLAAGVTEGRARAGTDLRARRPEPERPIRAARGRGLGRKCACGRGGRSGLQGRVPLPRKRRPRGRGRASGASLAGPRGRWEGAWSPQLVFYRQSSART